MNNASMNLGAYVLVTKSSQIVWKILRKGVAGLYGNFFFFFLLETSIKQNKKKQYAFLTDVRAPVNNTVVLQMK